MHAVPTPGTPDTTAELPVAAIDCSAVTTELSAPAADLPAATAELPVAATALLAAAPEPAAGLRRSGTKRPAPAERSFLAEERVAADALPVPADAFPVVATELAGAASELPVLAADLNARWAAARLPFRLNRRGVAQLWAVCAAGADLQAPLLFIVGSEPRAVRQAQRWAALAWPKAAAAAA